MIELTLEPESEPIYSCKVCGRQNVIEMVYETNSNTYKSTPLMCRECYDVQKAAKWETYRRQKQKEREREGVRKATVQATADRLRQKASGLPMTGAPAAAPIPSV